VFRQEKKIMIESRKDSQMYNAAFETPLEMYGNTLILLSGKARSGKNSVADILSRAYGFEQRSFAALLKEYAEKYFGLTRENMTEEKTAVSRRIMQGLGQVFRGEVDPMYWVKKIKDQMPNDSLSPVVITDARFINELRWGRGAGAMLWKIERENCPAIEAGADDSSETELEQWRDWDKIILNEDRPDWQEQLVFKVSRIMEGRA
jgi:hypothetical protein